jgi:acyl-coenzyme A thioesterase PaaI-like protein
MEKDKTHIDPEKDVFLANPACRSILEDPNFVVEPTHSRRYFPKTGENRFLAHTLKTNDTIEAWCSLYNRVTSARPMKDEVRTLFSLKGGLDGYPHICHGGLVATVLDEVCSMLVSECRWSQNQSPENVTASLTITYVKPVVTPGVVLVNAKVTDIQKSKKYFAKAELVDLEGVVRARAEGLFICVGLQKL